MKEIEKKSVVHKMELTKAEKGERKLVKDGYIYVFKKVLASDKVRANVFCEEKLAMSHNSPNLSH